MFWKGSINPIGDHPIFVIIDIPRGSHQQVPTNPPRQDPFAGTQQRVGLSFSAELVWYLEEQVPKL